MYKVVLFDLDGTLTDPMLGITRCVQHALRHFGIEEDIEKLTKFIGPPLIDSFMEFYNFTEDQARVATDVYRERFAPIGKFENEIYEGIPELLSALKEKGMLLAVASSKPELFVEEILEHFSIREYFDIVVGALMDETRTKKDEVLMEALAQIEERLSTDESVEAFENFDEIKKDIAMVGDRKFDVAGANHFGIAGVGVRYGYADPGELEAENPAFIADTVDELRNYLLA